MAVLEVQHLRKQYGNLTAVNDVSFIIGNDEIVGLLGPNGAGKTTIFNMILGVLEPTSGSIAISGINVARSRSKALLRTNFAAVYATLPGNLTVEQNLLTFGKMYDVANVRARLEEVLKAFALEPFRSVKCGVLSSGEQTRVGIAKALLSSPELLLLDEPTASLDPSSAQIVRSQIQAYAREKHAGVLWTSHNMHEVADVCDRVIFLSRGKTLLVGDPKTLPGEHGKSSLEELFITIAREPLTLQEV